MLQELADRICARNPFQRKALEPFLNSRDQLYWRRGNDAITRLVTYLQSVGSNMDEAAGAYDDLCREIMIETAHFKRTGKYSCGCQADAYDNVYRDEKVMRRYMIGVAVTLFLWPNHYALWDRYLSLLAERKGKVSRYLEIGPGHGMFLGAAVRDLQAESYTAIDISPASLKMTAGILPFLTDGDLERLRLIEQNVFEMDTDARYDLIVMGEVIEHLDDPAPILRKLASVLSDQGLAYFTTCANCPVKDHVYLMRSTEEMRDLVTSCGFELVDDLALSLSGAAVPAEGELINYACITRARRN